MVSAVVLGDARVLFLAVPVAGAVAGFVIGRWWTILLPACVWAAWMYYDIHTTTARVDGNLDVWLTFYTTVLVAVIAGCGLAMRQVMRRLKRQHPTHAGRE